MVVRRVFRILVEKVFFDRWMAATFCVFFSLISCIVELAFHIENLFSSSGSIFTIAGLFLNIKLTAHFHLKKQNGDPLDLEKKYALINGLAILGGNESLREIEARVREVENDEICGAFLMVIGTIIWGYGSYLMKNACLQNFGNAIRHFLAML